MHMLSGYLQWASIITLYFLVGIHSSDCCLNSPIHITDYSHTEWNAQESVSQSTIRSIIQSNDDHLWFGTQDGILEFNGDRFRSVRASRDFDGSEQVNMLLETTSGRLFAGTNKGLFIKQRDSFARYADVVGRVSAIVEYKDDALWFSTTTSGIFRCDDGSCIDMQEDIIGTQRLTVHALYMISDVLFVGTSNGLYEYDLNTGETTHHLGDTVVRTLEGRSVKSFFLGTNKGLFAYMNDEAVRIHPELVETGLDIWAVYQKRSSVFLGTNANGLIRVVEGQVESFSPDSPLSSAKVYEIFEDREGSIWVGTEGAGLHRIRSGPFQAFYDGKGRSVLGLHSDTDNLYIGTEGHGIVIVNEEVTTTFDTSNGLSGNIVTSFAGSLADSLWVGTLDGGLSIVHKGRARPFSGNSQLGTKGVYALYEDSDGAVWMGTDNGVFISKNRRIEAHPGVPAKNISAFFESDDRMWVGTYDQGLFSYQKGEFTQVLTADEVKADIILSLHESENGELWIGTYENGVFKYDWETLVAFSTEDGLPTNTAFQIIGDEKGDLWIGSNQGIYRLQPDLVEFYEAGRLEKIPAYLFNQASGIKTPEVNGGFQPAGTYFNSQVFFPTIDGVLYFDPNVVDNESKPINVEITDILIDGIAYSGENIEVPAHTENIIIRYNPVTFVGNDDILIRHSINQSLNMDWSRPTTGRELVINKPKGTFYVELQAMNHQGEWGDLTILAMETVVPFYNTIWFWVIVITVVMVLVVIVVSARYRTIQSRKDTLEKAVQERTAELDSAKSRIEQQAAALQQSLSEKDILLKEIHHRVRNNLQVISGLLYLQSNRIEDEEILKLFRQSEARIEAIAVVHEKLYASGIVESIHIAEYLSDLSHLVATSYQADTKGIQLVVECDDMVVKPDVATSIGLIVNELVSNVFKHAFDATIPGPKHVKVSFNKLGAYCKLNVLDNGKGVDATYDPENSRSLGLKIIHAFCEKLSADFSYETSEHTVFTVTIPIEVLFEQENITH